MERCHYPGSVSHDTHGGGPWYCRHHFFCSEQSEGGRIVAQSRKWKPGDPIPPRMRLIEAQAEPGAAG